MTCKMRGMEAIKVSSTSERSVKLKRNKSRMQNTMPKPKTRMPKAANYQLYSNMPTIMPR